MTRKGFVRPRCEVPGVNPCKVSSDEKPYQTPTFWICMGLIAVGIGIVVLALCGVLG